LIIWGSDDGVFPIRNAARLAKDISGSTVRIIESSGHLPQIEQTAAFLEAVLPFIESKD
jgi:pimeloyl-ACP methyl ester carboxylesterase